MVAKITSLEDVRLFAQHLVNDPHLNFHLDDDFACYRNYDTKQPTFSAAEAAHYNALMNECFDVYEKECADVFEIMGQYLHAIVK